MSAYIYVYVCIHTVMETRIILVFAIFLVLFCERRDTATLLKLILLHEGVVQGYESSHVFMFKLF